MNREERQTRLIHRIESFSDLVIGFSLALLALTLSIPVHAGDLVKNPWWLIAYFWTFAVIARIWFDHQRLFTHYFWPEQLTIFLNFAMLSMIGLIVFFVQVFVHFHNEVDRVWAFIAYFIVQGIAFLVIGLLYWHGTTKRWSKLDPVERYLGIRSAVRGVAVGSLTVFGGAFCALHYPVASIADVLLLPVVIISGAALVQIGLRLAKPRIVQAANA